MIKKKTSNKITMIIVSTAASRLLTVKVAM